MSCSRGDDAVDLCVFSVVGLSWRRCRMSGRPMLRGSNSDGPGVDGANDDLCVNADGPGVDGPCFRGADGPAAYGRRLVALGAVG